MTKIAAPSEQIQKILEGQDNVENLNKWILLVTNPFSPFPYADFFRCYSIVDGTRASIDHLSDYKNAIIVVTFPINVKGLLGEESNGEYTAVLILKSDNQAMMEALCSETIFQGTNKRYRVEGTWEEVVSEYLRFLKTLMSAPEFTY
jgi:hypothetical protein